MAQDKVLSLPARPNIQYLKKLAKDRLRDSREKYPKSTLAQSQLAIARQYGFASWQKLKEHVDAAQTIDAATIEQFFKSIERGEKPEVLAMLKRWPQLIGSNDSDGRSPLHMAVEVNRANLIQPLLKHSADPNGRYKGSAHNALSWALVVQAFDAARELIKAGIKPDLYCAAAMGSLKHVKASFRADGSVRDNASQTGSTRYVDGKRLPPVSTPREVVSDALYIAARNGQAAVVKFLLTKKPDLQFRAFLGAPLLHWAHFGGSTQVIQMLRDAGADPSERDPAFGCTPRAFGICVPASWGIIRLVIDRLKDDPSLVNINEGRGTPLHEAARSGHVDIVKLLVAAGAEVNARDRDGRTPLELASSHRDVPPHASGDGEARQKFDETVAILKDPEPVRRAVRDAVATKHSNGRQPKVGGVQELLDACLAGDVELVRRLLDAGVDPNLVSRTAHRHRPLHRVVEHKKTMPKHAGHDATVKLLLERGADPHLRGSYGRLTALTLAAAGEPRFVLPLRERFGELDIFHAADLCDAPRVESLLKQDRKRATAQDEIGWTALHHCAASAMFHTDEALADAQLRIARMLLKTGADPNAAYLWEGKHPLSVLYHAAGWHDNPKLVELLLAAGADFRDGETIHHASDELHAHSLAVIETHADKKSLAEECTRALIWQMRWGRTRGMAWMLDHGADPTRVDPKLKKSAIQLARDRGKPRRIIDALKAAAK